MRKLPRILKSLVPVLVVTVLLVGMIVSSFPRESLEPLVPWLKYGLIGCVALHVICSLVCTISDGSEAIRWFFRKQGD